MSSTKQKLRALEATEILQLFAGLVAEQILDGMEHRARMRLHRDAILRLQHREIQRRHDRRQRRRRRLMAADLEAVGIGANVVGVVDGPGREPQHLARQRREDLEASVIDRHGGLPYGKAGCVGS